jgi:hypothetical protein
MRSKLYIALTLLILSYTSSMASNQPPMGEKKNLRLNYRGFVQQYSRWEAGFSLGVANSMTDIAPRKADTQSTFTDVYSRGFSPAISLNTRYRFDQSFSMKLNLGALMLKGNDKWSPDIDVVNRGKSFSNNLVEGSLLAEFYLPKSQFKSKKDFKYNIFDVFIFSGISAFYHSPEVLGPIIDEYDQNLLDRDDIYSNIQIAVPLGLGIQWTLANKWTIGADMNFRYTFFDYLDGFKRPNSTQNDYFFTSNVSIGYIINSKAFKTKGSSAGHVFTNPFN